MSKLATDREFCFLDRRGLHCQFTKLFYLSPLAERQTRIYLNRRFRSV